MINVSNCHQQENIHYATHSAQKTDDPKNTVNVKLNVVILILTMSKLCLIMHM